MRLRPLKTGGLKPRTAQSRSAESAPDDSDRIVEGELALAVLLRVTAGYEQLGVELAVAEEVRVVGRRQVAGVVPGRRDDVLLEHRRRERVADVQAGAEAAGGDVVVQQAADALEARQGVGGPRAGRQRLQSR